MARILVVDDVPMNRKLIRGYFEGSGHLLVDADSGERALLVAEAERPDLVLLDVMMPGLDGFETTQRLKQQAGEDFLPIILLTALNDRKSRILGLEMGADDFLTKPVDRHELHLRARNLLALRANDILLRRRNVELAELNRFKDEMSSLIVHDLKSPMSVIIANHDYVEDGLGGGDPSYRQALDDSRSAARRIMRLLANLLDASHLEGNRMVPRGGPVPLTALLGEIVKQRRLSARSRDVAVEVASAPDAVAQADADLLARVVENILDNALRHARTRVHIDARTVDGLHLVQVRIGNDGGAVPAEARSLIFEKYGQMSPLCGRMRLGLGLYFCRLATEAQGGRIWVEETPELSTVFVVELPACEERRHE